MSSGYVPERGDLVWLEFDPQSGHEQRGRRPALVISPSRYNEKVGLALFCPITSKVKGYPFEVALSGPAISGAVLSDQIKSLDWRARNAQFLGKTTADELAAVIERLQLLVSP